MVSPTFNTMDHPHPNLWVASDNKFKQANNLFATFLDAARNKDAEGLRRCLECGVNVNSRDDLRGNSALHLVLAQGCYSDQCVSNIERCIRILLRNGANPNSENLGGQTPLHLILQRAVPTSIAKILIQHGATLVKGNGLADPELTKEISLKRPEILAALLDTAISFDPEKTVIIEDVLIEAIKLDWRFLVYSSDSSKETMYLNDVLEGSEQTRKIILTHPLVKAFLHLKRPLYWRHFGFFHCIWILTTLLLYITFIWIVYNDVCKYHGPIKSSNSTLTDNETTTPESEEEGPICDLGYKMMGVAFLTFMLFIFTQFFMEWRKLMATGFKIYVQQWQHWLYALMLCCVLITLYPAFKFPFVGSFELTWEYAFAAIGMVVGCLSILIQMAPFPYVAIYLEMMFKTFLKIVLASCALSPLLIGFYLAFQILVPREHEIGIFQLLTMIVSDTDYDVLVDDHRDEFYVVATYLTFGAFIIIIVIVLLNFLIGLAVSDIQELRESAKSTNLANQVRSYYTMDSVYGHRRQDHRSITKGGREMSLVFHPFKEKRSIFPMQVNVELMKIARSRCVHIGGSSDNKNFVKTESSASKKTGILARLRRIVERKEVKEHSRRRKGREK